VNATTPGDGRDGLSAASYPEHGKLAQVSEQSQAIGEFLDFGRWTLCRWNEKRHEYLPLKIEDALAEWFGIDQEALDREKREMLEAIRVR
jgi:hypothetical protein